MATKPEIIIGFDPGYADTGWGIIKKENSKFYYIACGSIRTSKKTPWPERLLTLWQETEKIITTYQPDKAGIESLFFNTNQTTAMKVAEARGVLVTLCAQHQLQPIELTPAEIKLAVTGNGRADKQQIGKMVCLLLSLTTLPQPDDATDALACALAADRSHI